MAKMYRVYSIIERPKGKTITGNEAEEGVKQPAVKDMKACVPA